MDNAPLTFWLERSAALWLSCWGIRSKWEIDYKLSPNARLIRWGVVAAGLVFGGASNTIPWLRGSATLIGLSFLCWPNLAYYLSASFQEWPTIEGRVVSAQERSPSRWLVSYDFEIDGERYGGSSRQSCEGSVAQHEGFPEGSRVLISYDPLNPGRRSRLMGRVQ